MSSYVIHRYWSVVHCTRVARLSMADDHGQEYFATVPMAHLRGKGYRERLYAVLDQVRDAITAGAGPGEVIVSLADVSRETPLRAA